MSQKKVDEYKNYKKNRRENIKKEKRKETIGHLFLLRKKRRCG